MLINTKSIVRAISLLSVLCCAGMAGAAPHEILAQLSRQVETLTTQKVLTAGQGKSLGVKLSHAARALQRGKAKSSMRQLVTFEKKTAALTASKALPQKDGQHLIFLAESTRHEIDQLAFALPEHIADSIQPCFSDTGCEYTVLHVNGTAQESPDGSQDRPFPTVAEALAYALLLQTCGVELRLAPGTYREVINTPMNLKLRGTASGVVIEGSIVNHDGWALDIERLQLDSSAPPGAIVIDSDCPAKTRISRVQIQNAARYGVFQRGGSLRLDLSTVSNTLPETGDLSTGSGVFLTGGVQAIIGLVNIERSSASGLVADGTSTRVYVAASRFADGDLNPFIEPPSETSPRPPGSGVDVRQGALMLMQFSTVSGNELYGVAVRDDARLHFRYGTIEHTRVLPPSHPLRSLADSNMIGYQAAAIELTSFTVQHSLAGLIMFESPASASIGTIRHHEIGMFLRPAPLDSETFNNAFRCLTNSVRFHNNTRNIDGAFLPIPDDGDSDPPTCVQVPFNCDWCAL